MRYLVLLAALSLLAACSSSQSQTLTSHDGKQVTCFSSGTGMIPMIIASNRFDDCVKAANGRGFF